MANTTKANVLAMAPELSDLPENMFTLVLADVANEVGTAFGKHQEKAQRLLAAHYLTLWSPDQAKDISGPVTQEKTGDESTSYDKGPQDRSRYDTTVYGQQFVALKKAAVPSFAAFTP